MIFYHYTYLPVKSRELDHLQEVFEQFKVDFNLTDPDNDFTLHLTGPSDMVECNGEVLETDKYLKVSWTSYIDFKKEVIE